MYVTVFVLVRITCVLVILPLQLLKSPTLYSNCTPSVPLKISRQPPAEFLKIIHAMNSQIFLYQKVYLHLSTVNSCIIPPLVKFLVFHCIFQMMETFVGSRRFINLFAL